MTTVYGSSATLAATPKMAKSIAAATAILNLDKKPGAHCRES